MLRRFGSALLAPKMRPSHSGVGAAVQKASAKPKSKRTKSPDTVKKKSKSKSSTQTTVSLVPSAADAVEGNKIVIESDIALHPTVVVKEDLIISCKSESNEMELVLSSRDEIADIQDLYTKFVHFDEDQNAVFTMIGRSTPSKSHADGLDVLGSGSGEWQRAQTRIAFPPPTTSAYTTKVPCS